MKKLYYAAVLLVFWGCSKEQKQQRQEDLVLQAMVNGQWKVTRFDKGATELTSDFAAYLFQFRTNYTVDAINNGIVEKTGTWNADPVARTIASNFVNSTNPLLLLNGTWTIQNTSWTYVLASQTVNGELRTLELNKQ